MSVAAPGGIVDIEGSEFSYFSICSNGCVPFTAIGEAVWNLHVCEHAHKNGIAEWLTVHVGVMTEVPRMFLAIHFQPVLS